GAPLRKCGGVPLGRRRQRVLQGEADGRLQRRDEALDEGSGLLSAGLGGDRELAVEVLDVQVQVHGTTMAPLWCHINPSRCQIGISRPRTWQNVSMPTHIALLRGINVGGRNRVAMADLRKVVLGLGYTDVATYIQSGNVVF